MDRSFDEVYELYGNEVHAYLQRLLGNAYSADELCQETFVRYLAHEQALVAMNGTLRPWLYRVATNLGIDRLRRRRTRRNARGSDRPERTPALPSAEALDQERRIRAEVEALPPDLRATFLLRAHHGLAFRDVAAALGVSERAAKARFRKTRDRLALRLKHLLEESDS